MLIKMCCDQSYFSLKIQYNILFNAIFLCAFFQWSVLATLSNFGIRARIRQQNFKQQSSDSNLTEYNKYEVLNSHLTWTEKSKTEINSMVQSCTKIQTQKLSTVMISFSKHWNNFLKICYNFNINKAATTCGMEL